MTMKDYAHKCGVSYEAIRKQVRRYENELEGHVMQKGRVQVLDDWAVDFLDDKRQGNPVVVAQADLQQQLQQLLDENKGLLIKVAAQASELAGAYKELSEAKDKALLLPAAQQEAKEAQEKLQEAQKAAQEAQREAERLRHELEAERQKGFFQRLFGR